MDYKIETTCGNSKVNQFCQRKASEDFFERVHTLYGVFVERRKDWVDDLQIWGLKGLKGKEKGVNEKMGREEEERVRW